MRVAGFMSGSGTNLIKILEKQAALQASGKGCPFRVVVIFSDNQAGNAASIAETYGVPLVERDILEFYRSRGHTNKKDMTLRPEFDRLILEALDPFHPDALVLAGYMSVVSAPLLQAFPGRIINVHPADLRIQEGNQRKFTGDQTVRDAILAGESVLRSSTHIVREEVDGGEILMVSEPLPVVLPEGMALQELARPENRTRLEEISDEHQERLKEMGDWIILPQTLVYLAQGRYTLAPGGGACLDGEPVG